MNEHETNPQRHEATSSGEPTHQHADAARDVDPQRGQSDSTTPLASPAPYGSGEPTTAEQPAVQQSGAAPTIQQPPVPYPTGPAATTSQPPAWQQPAQQEPWRPGQQPGHPPYGGYDQQQTYPGEPQYAGQPPHGTWAGGPDAGPGHQLPAWAQPVGTDQRDPAKAGRGRRIFVTGAAAVLLALTAGGVGAAAALALDDNDGILATRTGDSSVTRVVDRSSVAEIAALVQDSVVSINTGNGEGSGVVMSADGYVLTNNHVVATAPGGKLRMVFANGKSAQATVVGTDPRTDLAVVKADGVTDLKPATFGKSAKMKVGDTVLALGSPLGLEGSVTSGIISAKDRTIRAGAQGQPQPNPFGEQPQSAGVTSMSGLLQTDAAINPGNSGGALVNVAGEVIGINTAIATSGQGSGNIGLGFAIPSDKAYDVAEQLKAGQKVSHPALGVSVAEVEGGGAAINSVTEGSAAAKAGLQKGDVITQVNGTPINDSDDLIAVIQSGKVGDQVTVTYTRDGAQKTANATLAEAS
jgi:putative serine protease PepD